jgi:YVTN family beta-propeller protein
MTRAYGWFVAAALGAALSSGCGNPTDVPQNALADRQPPRGDGTVKRLALSGRPVALKVSRTGFAYAGQTDESKLARLDLETQEFGAAVQVGLVPSDVVFNSTSTRAYVSNQWSQNVGVIDVASNTQIDTIPTTGDPFALAISPDNRFLFVTTNIDALWKIDLTTNTVVASIPLVATSHHILMHPRGTFLYVATRDGGTVMEVDWRNMTVARTFSFGGRTQDMAFSPNQQELYISNELSNVLHVLKLSSGDAHSIPLAGGGEGLALGDGGTLLYVGLVFDGYVQIIDRKTEVTQRLLPVGGIPREIQLDVSGASVIMTNEGGWVDIIEPSDSIVPPPPPPPPPDDSTPPPPPPDTNFVRLPLGGSPGFVAVFNDIAYVSQSSSASVARLELAADTFTTFIAVGNVPCGVVFNGSGTTAYVANQLSDNISIIDVASNTQTGTIPLNGDPLPVAISKFSTWLYVTTNVNRLYKINLATNTVVDSLDLPATSHHLLVHPNDTLLYVATRDAGTVLEVNALTFTVRRTFTFGGRTQGMAIAQNSSELYVANELSNQLHFITLSTGSTSSIPLAGGGENLALTADGSKIFVGLVFDGQVQVVDRSTRTIERTITTGGVPREMATDAARARIIVTNESGWVDIMR